MEEVKINQNETREEDLFDVVNRGKPAGENRPISTGNFNKGKRKGWYLFLAILNTFIDILGWIGLGAAMVAAMVLELAPNALTIPVALLCCMWVAVRVDRCFRR